MESIDREAEKYFVGFTERDVIYGIVFSFYNPTSIKSRFLILYDFSMKTVMITDMKILGMIVCGIHFYS